MGYKQSWSSFPTIANVHQDRKIRRQEKKRNFYVDVDVYNLIVEKIVKSLENPRCCHLVINTYGRGLGKLRPPQWASDPGDF